MLKGTWTKQGDQLMVRVQGTDRVTKGDKVSVTKKNGKVTIETAGSYIFAHPLGFCLFVPVRKKSNKAVYIPRKPNGWRPCEYPSCNPSYCDNCDGKGETQAGLYDDYE